MIRDINATFTFGFTKLIFAACLLMLFVACESEMRATSPVAEDKQSEPDIVTTMDAAAPSFTLGSTRISGALSADGLVDYYLGIPFAQPPVAELRWMPPKLINEMPAQFSADEFADACMQGPHLANWYKGVILSFGGDPESFPMAPVSEDCLYLNIWRPHLAGQAHELNKDVVSTPNSLPVFVFIHGGSNKGGWSYEPNYIGEELSKRGIIVISIAYRLGAFGFFSHPELEHSNFGLLDQVAALQWIQENIAALGGDPNRVTVAGESAGANNIEYLISMPQAKGLFQRAIHQSGGSPMLDRNSKQAALQLGEKLFAEVLANKAVDPLKAVNSSLKAVDPLKAVNPLKAVAQLQAMRSASADEIQSAAEEVYRGHYFDVVVDRKSVSQSVSDAALKSEFAAIDLMIGTNANENLMYLDANETLENWLSVNASNVSLEKVRQILGPASSAPGGSALQQLDKVSSGRAFTCPSLQFAESLSQSGGHSWVYYFSKVREGELAEKMGAYHGAELPYMFGTHDDWLPTDAADRTLSETMMAYWVQFIKTGNPNSGGTPTWSAFRQAGDEVQVLDRVVGSSQHPSHHLCQELL